jgi:DNA glycosylase AlkZ-like
MREIGLRGLNRATLARQGLLEALPAGELAALRRLGPLHWQSPGSPFLALWARLSEFSPDAMAALCAERAVVKSTLVRGTLHMVAADAYPGVAVAAEEGRRGMWQRNLRAAGIDGEALLEAVARLVDGAEAGTDEIAAFCARWVSPDADVAMLSSHKWKIVRGSPRLLLVAPGGRWASTPVGRYRSARSQLPGLSLPEPAAALVEVVRRQLAALGPATEADLAFWTGERRITRIRAALRELDTIELAGPAGATYLDLPDAPRPDPRTPAPVRLLPAFDAVLLGYAAGARQRVVPAEHTASVYLSANATVRPVLLVDGFATGTWRFDTRAVTLFAPLPPGVRAEVDAQVERLTPVLDRLAGAGLSGRGG